GLEVHVVGPEAQPLVRVLGEQLSAMVRKIHEDKGVVFHLGKKGVRIEADAVILDDGTRLAADLVVAGVGVRPRTELAEKAGLKVDRGVVTDEHLRAAPHVYAIGDIARFPGLDGQLVRIEHWVVAQRHGESVARSILGDEAPFRDVSFFWSAHFDVTIRYVGHAESWDRSEVSGDPMKHDASVRYWKGARLLAVATVGRDLEALEASRDRGA
ncbi:MAG: FAD-dependent oxidoreductase, partial [Polyangia bacterium]